MGSVSETQLQVGKKIHYIWALKGSVLVSSQNQITMIQNTILSDDFEDTLITMYQSTWSLKCSQFLIEMRSSFDQPGDINRFILINKYVFVAVLVIEMNHKWYIFVNRPLVLVHSRRGRGRGVMVPYTPLSPRPFMGGNILCMEFFWIRISHDTHPPHTHTHGLLSFILNQ